MLIPIRVRYAQAQPPLADLAPGETVPGNKACDAAAVVHCIERLGGTVNIPAHMPQVPRPLDHTLDRECKRNGRILAGSRNSAGSQRTRAGRLNGDAARHPTTTDRSLGTVNNRQLDETAFDGPRRTREGSTHFTDTQLSVAYQSHALNPIPISCHTVPHHADRHATDISRDGRQVHCCLQIATPPWSRALYSRGLRGLSGTPCLTSAPSDDGYPEGDAVPPGRRTTSAPARGPGDDAGKVTMGQFMVLTGGLSDVHPSKRQPLPGTENLWQGMRTLGRVCRQSGHGR